MPKLSTRIKVNPNYGRRKVNGRPLTKAGSEDKRSVRMECKFGCGMELGPQGYKNHVKTRHKEQYAIGLRLAGIGDPRFWSETIIRDIRSIMEADAIPAVPVAPATLDLLLDETPDCGPVTIHDQIYETVRGLNLCETAKVFSAVLHLKVEDNHNRIQKVLDEFTFTLL